MSYPTVPLSVILEEHTNKNEANRNNVGQHVTPDRLIVFSISFPEKANDRVELIFTEALLEGTKYHNKALTEVIILGYCTKMLKGKEVCNPFAQQKRNMRNEF